MELFYNDEIINTYEKKIIAGIALFLKRNSKQNIKSLNEVKEYIKNNLPEMISFIKEEQIVKIINELLILEEQELIKIIMYENDIRNIFDVYTPQTEAELIEYILNIKDNAKVLDLYSGEGKLDEIIAKNHKEIKIDGYEINRRSIDIATLKMYALNQHNVKYYQKDILVENIKEKYQYAVADIPFISQYNEKMQKSLEEIYQKLDLKITKRISTAWMTVIKILNCLEENGRAVITTMKGSLFNTLDRDIRKELITKGYIEAIIDLPNKIVSYTNADLSLIIISKSNPKSEVKFVDLRKCVKMSGKINSIDIEKAKKVYHQEGLNINLKKIVNNNYSLNLDIYAQSLEIQDGIELGKVSDDIFRGYQITSSEINKMLVENEKDMNYKILEISNINDEGEICSELKKINSKQKDLDRYLLKNGDILISARGDKIKKCLINISNNERIIANGSINVIRVNKTKITPLYLKMFLESKKGILKLNSIKSGVTISSINVGELQKLIIPCPTIKQQEKIVEKFIIKIEEIKTITSKLEQAKKELKSLADSI